MRLRAVFLYFAATFNSIEKKNNAKTSITRIQYTYCLDELWRASCILQFYPHLNPFSAHLSIDYTYNGLILEKDAKYVLSSVNV